MLSKGWPNAAAWALPRLWACLWAMVAACGALGRLALLAHQATRLGPWVLIFAVILQR